MDRKEAIEVIKKNYPHVGISGSEFETALRELVPELAESEDERIRKILIHIVKGACDKYGIKYRGNEIGQEKLLSYLERQKERQPVEIHIDNPNIQKFDSDVKVTTSDSSADGKELLYVSNKSYDIGFRDGVASVKPAEWSDEDDAKWYGVIETEEYMLRVVRGEQRFDVGNKEIERQCEEELDWLKSLRPQPHWKPSEEQIKALNAAINFCASASSCYLNDAAYNILKGLRSDLKKL